jgi:hypothetical protein
MHMLTILHNWVSDILQEASKEAIIGANED